MRRQNAAIAMQQRKRRVADLASARASRHLQIRLDQMRHRAADAAMAVAQEPAVGVERQLSVAAEVTGMNASSSLPASCETQVFQQHRSVIVKLAA